jgi:thiamine kinase-like enzyme
LKLIPPKGKLEEEYALLKAELCSLGSPVVFCHNDLLLANVIYNAEKSTVTFIDYEYSNYNYQAFDIGNHFAEFAGKNYLFCSTLRLTARLSSTIARTEVTQNAVGKISPTALVTYIN